MCPPLPGTADPSKTVRKVLSQREQVGILWPAADFPSVGSNSQRWNEAAQPSCGSAATIKLAAVCRRAASEVAL